MLIPPVGEFSICYIRRGAVLAWGRMWHVTPALCQLAAEKTGQCDHDYGTLDTKHFLSNDDGLIAKKL